MNYYYYLYRSLLGLFCFSILLTVYTGGRTQSQSPVAMCLASHRTAQSQNKFMHRAGYELRCPAFVRAKIIYSLKRSASVIGMQGLRDHEFVVALTYRRQQTSIRLYMCSP
jgi:hypothetical protein